jgi:hypothetical protein
MKYLDKKLNLTKPSLFWKFGKCFFLDAVFRLKLNCLLKCCRGCKNYAYSISACNSFENLTRIVKLVLLHPPFLLSFLLLNGINALLFFFSAMFLSLLRVPSSYILNRTYITSRREMNTDSNKDGGHRIPRIKVEQIRERKIDENIAISSTCFVKTKLSRKWSS